MKPGKLLAIALIAGCLGVVTPGAPALWQGFTIRGRIVMTAPAQTQAQVQLPVSLLTVKLYPPEEKGGAALLTYPDKTGNFRFSDLPEDSYSLKIFQGDQPLYEKVLKLESSALLTIPVGTLKMVDQVTIEDSKSGVLNGADFKGDLLIKVGDIRSNLSPEALLPMRLYYRRKKLRTFYLRLSMLFTTFALNGQTYTLAGGVRKIGNTEYIDCEIFR
jgi:hypothetical protein